MRQSPSVMTKIEQIERELQVLISASKSTLESNLLLSLHPNKTSKVFRNIIGQTNIPNSVRLNGSFAESGELKANFFNKYFHSIFKRPDT